MIGNLSAAYITLGCKLNFAETASLGDKLATMGVRRAEPGEAADICVINTCTVTETSNHKCRQAINRALREHPNAMTVVMGCYAQLAAQQLAAIVGVDLVIGTAQKAQAAELIMAKIHGDATPAAAEPNSFAPSCSRGERTRFFLKVQDGCDYYCTYCAIPFARGRSRNGSIRSLVAQAHDVVAQGGREIVITGVNIGDFGKTTGERFIDLVRALDAVEGIERYRISSIEPNLLTEEIIDFCARSRRFMPHFHIPLQSGSDEVLRLMHRRYDTELFRARVDYIKKVMPDCFIGVDIIVGTRGETDELFEQSYSFAEAISVSQFHVFSYSERPGTAALRIPHVVPEQTKRERSKRLLALSERKRIDFYRAHIGQIRPILTEHSHGTLAAKGFTDNYIHVEVPHSEPLPDNTVLAVRLAGFNDDKTALVGTLCNKEN